jgi:hypothetical protein
VFRQRYGNKFGAKRQEYGGKQYHSKKEAGYASELDLRVRAGDIKSWERQKRIALDVNGYHITNYYIDFVVTHNDGSIEYVEVKGFETDVWRMKWALFEALYSGQPDVRLTVVK